MVVPADAASREPLLARGVLDMCVLAVLDRSPRHAYGVVERLEEHGFSASYGTIYPLVTRLRRLGLVDQHPESSPAGPPRKVLSTTPEGRRVLAEWTRQWRSLSANVESLLTEPEKDLEPVREEHARVR